MARGLNKAIIIGNLGADPEVRLLPNGGQVANVNVATTEQWRDKTTGENRENTEWHRVVFFGRLAEIVSEYLKKGSQVYIEGRIQTRKWQDQSGQDRYSTEIVANEMQMLGSRQDSAAGPGASAGRQAQAGGAASPPAGAVAAAAGSQTAAKPAPPMDDGFDGLDIPL